MNANQGSRIPVVTAMAVGFSLLILPLGGCGSCQKESGEDGKMQIQTPEEQVRTIKPEPEPAKPEPAQPKVVESKDGKYTVQVSSWRSRRNAERDLQRYREHGIDGYVQPANIPSKGGTWYRVRIGKGLTREEALDMANSLVELLESGYWIDSAKKN